MKYPLDVKIADYFRRICQFYIRKRLPIKQIVPEKSEENIWLSNFEVNQDKFEYMLSDGVKIYLYKDSILCRMIYFSFEETEIGFLKNFLKPGDCFFDIGANIGLFSLHASPIVDKNGSIYAFEPTPETYYRLNQNILLNNFKNIIIENTGLSDTSGSTEFHVSTNGYDALNSIVVLSELENNHTTISVNTDTVDNYVKLNKIVHIDLIKVDVEGWELNVLKGATSVLTEPDAPVLMVEFTEKNAFTAGYYLGELYDYLVTLGYKWYSYNLKENKLIPEKKKLHYSYENLIAIKNISSVFSRLKID